MSKHETSVHQKQSVRYNHKKWIIPSDWTLSTLGEVAPLQRGFDLPESKIRSGPYPVVYSNGVLEHHEQSMAKCPGVVTGRSGTIGKVHFIEEDYWPHNTSLWVTSFCGNDPKFIYYLYIHINLVRLLSGSGVPTLNRNDVHQYTVPLPSISEQRAIAEVLSDVDGLLRALEALIAKKRAIKLAAMQQLVTGKTRLPGFSGGWETKRLGDIALFLKGSGLSKADLSLDGRRRCIHYGELFTVYGERITEVLHGTDREGSFFYSSRNDVLMPTSDVTPNGLATASCILASEIVIGADVLVIRAPEDVLKGEFLAYAVKTGRYKVMQLVSGTTVFHLYGRDMANFSFAVPSVEEQCAIAVALSDMAAEIAALIQRRNKVRAAKQGMMQQLLSGRVRLIEPERIADA